MTAEKKKLPEDRTELADLWAEAVARVDELTELLADARKREAEVWEALRSSRLKSVPSEDM